MDEREFLNGLEKRDQDLCSEEPSNQDIGFGLLLEEIRRQGALTRQFLAEQLEVMQEDLQG